MLCADHAGMLICCASLQTVMYFSRTPGTGGTANNGGRMVLNEVMSVHPCSAICGPLVRG